MYGFKQVAALCFNRLIGNGSALSLWPANSIGRFKSWLGLGLGAILGLPELSECDNERPDPVKVWVIRRWLALVKVGGKFFLNIFI